MMTNPGARSTAKKPSHFDPSQQTFSKIMRNHGYQTAVMGKWHLRLKNGKPTNPAKVGFDKFAFKTGAGGPYYDPHGYLQNPSMRSTKIEKKSHKGYITDIFTDMAIKTMKEFNGNSKPFLMMMQFFSDHRPFDPPHKYKNLYEGQRIPEPSTFWDEYQTRPALNTNQLRIEGMQDFNPPSDLTDRQRKQYNYQHLLKHFLGTLKAQDDNIGRLLDYLDRSGVAENTIVVYTSDHGSFLGEHGLFDKRFMYEQSIRVPWMIRYPGIAEKGSKTEKWSINIDNAPTILDLVNLPVPDDMQGKSLKPIIQGKSFSNWQHNLYYHYFEKHWALPNYGIRTERYKLINYYTINQWELYDLKKDPDEMENLFIMTDLFSYDKYKTKPGYKSVVGDLLKRLYKLSRKYKDTTVKPVNLKPV
jgi:arylsulfatase A-like enzyme